MQTAPCRPLPHHRLRVWHRALELVKLVVANPPSDAELRSQATRAAKSVALNIAEGAPLRGRSRHRHFDISRGSVGEVAGAYEIADTTGDSVPVGEVLDHADAIYAMLTKLMR